MICLVLLLLACPSWAAHPLITDDAGTQGKGNFQLELNGQYDWDRDHTEDISVSATGGQAGVTLSYGVAENVDLVLILPYLWGQAEVNEITVYDEKGIGDAVLETKLRLFEKSGFSLAFKPGISFPTGNEVKGLGTGKLGGHLFLIASQELGSWAFHGNLGYIRNENKVDERKDIWHASLATTWEVIKDVNLVVNVGIDRNPDKEAKNDTAFLIGGIIYSINENIDVDLGIKCGLTEPETDFSLLTGVAFRF
ncbi:MAG: transporter [Deltaproteobacteria bacterium HGW-Deltaproteobacteria-10]|nr:MAG: transporter [Deltaproteobacteria bacterium HGW-Deltaproteobacteria-2]PKN75531.1 MAG: transporter [Deltaproteobacteria bacterium HGW-Deltaproteobacteria-10]